MYSIETCFSVNGEEQRMTVYSDVLVNQSTKVADPVLELEDNSAGSLEFTIYPTNSAYGTLEEEDDPISLMTSTIRVYVEAKDSTGAFRKEELWEGRPLTIDKDFYNGKKVYCEGALCYLNDIDQPAYEYTAYKIQNECNFLDKKSVPGGFLEFVDFFKAVLTSYNERAAANRQFDVESTYVNPVRIPIGYAFKGCLADIAAIRQISNPSENDIYQTMTGLEGYRTRGYKESYAELSDLDNVQMNDLCYVTADEVYYVYDGAAWAKTHVMDYVGEYYVYAPNPKSTASQIELIWTDVTTQIHLTCGIARNTGGETTKEAIGKIVSDFGGHLRVRTVHGKRCLYYTAKIYPEDEYTGVDPKLKPQSVTFGKNLIDLTRKRDGSEFFTVLLPIGSPINREHPETIESMCENIFEDGSSVTITPYHNDLTLDTRAQPYDATQQLFLTSMGRDAGDHKVPRRVFKKEGLEPGYSYYLFATSFNQDSAADPLIRSNTYMYLVYDEGPNLPTKAGAGDLAQGGIAHPYYVGPMITGETFEQSEEAIYANDRLLKTKTLPVSDLVTELVGEEFTIPEKGSGQGYTLYFSNAILYSKCQVTSGTDAGKYFDLPSSFEEGYWDDKILAYPKLYKAPYSNYDFIHRRVRKVDDRYIWWAGCSVLGGTDRSDIDPHKLQIGNDKYGTDNWCFHLQQNSYVSLLHYSNSGRSSWHVPLDKTQSPGSMWKNNVNPNWAFSTGEAGYHIARVIVEPGKTYYLNTRVTNPGYPKSSYRTVGSVDDLSSIPALAWDMAYVTDPSENRMWIYNPSEGWESYWPIGSGTKYDYSHLDPLGEMKGGREYTDVIAYAVVACRTVFANGSTAGEVPSWGYQILEKKLADRSQVTTSFNMQEIKIPKAIPPEVEKPYNTLRFYDPSTGQAECQGTWFPTLDQTVHLELWFTCDQCYINGNGEYDQEGRLVGYVPELFVEDETAVGNDEGVNYKHCVTIKPLQPKQVNGDKWPEEYLINKELYDKYGPIVKVANYPEAYTPTQLMTYAKTEMNKMKGEESFEVSAVDLKSCGMSDCDRLRLMQKIKINDQPHGIDSAIALTQMTVHLMDLSQNTYTLGYEANRGISATREDG